MLYEIQVGWELMVPGLVLTLFVCLRSDRYQHMLTFRVECLCFLDESRLTCPASIFYNISIESFSGGLEITELNEQVLISLKNCGFFIERENIYNTDILQNLI